MRAEEVMLCMAKPVGWDKTKEKSQYVAGYYWTNLLGNHFIRTAMIGSRYSIDDIEIDPNTLRRCSGSGERIGEDR